MFQHWMDDKILMKGYWQGIQEEQPSKPWYLISEGTLFYNDHSGKHDGFRESENEVHKTLDVLKSMVDPLNGIKIDVVHIQGNSRTTYP